MTRIKITTVAVKPETFRKLQKLGTVADSMNDVINGLIEEHNRKLEVAA